MDIRKNTLLKKKLCMVLIMSMVVSMFGPAFAEVQTEGDTTDLLPAIEAEAEVETTTGTMQASIKQEESVIEEELIIEDDEEPVETTTSTMVTPLTEPTDILFNINEIGVGADQGIFIPNKGQMDERVAYKSRIPNGDLFVEKDGQLTYLLYFEDDTIMEEENTEEDVQEGVFTEEQELVKLQGWALKEHFVGGLTPEFKEKKPTKTDYTYLKGNDKSKHVKKIKGYQEVKAQEIYEGINLNLVTKGDNVEKIYEIAPGVSPETLQLKMEGANAMRINTDGELEIDTDYGTVAFTAPVAYQSKNGKDQVDVAYTLNNGVYGFEVSGYDPEKTLYIDPLIASSYIANYYRTYAYGVTRDSDNRVIVTGSVLDSGYPTTAGAFDTTHDGDYDGFVSIFDSKVENLIASTYFSGTGGYYDSGDRVCELPDGNIAIMGRTKASDFPMAGNPYDSTFNGKTDIVMLIFTDDLTTLVASTYLGSYSTDSVGDFVYSEGYFYLAGTAWQDFPVTPGDNRVSSFGESIFIAKLSEDLSELSASTLFGGNYPEVGYDIALDQDGDVYVTGRNYRGHFITTAGSYDTGFNGGYYDAVVARWSNDLVTLKASTYLGGSGYDYGYGIDIDSYGNVIIGGNTSSDNFPTTANAYSTTRSGSYDGFITIMDKNLTTVKKSTLIGGLGYERIRDLSVDSIGNIIAIGQTKSDDYPTTDNCFDATRNGDDAFITKIDGDLEELENSTFIGGSGYEYAHRILIDDQDMVYFTGETSSTDFPVLPNAYQTTYTRPHNTSFIMVIPRALSGFSAADYYVPFELPGGIEPSVGAYRTTRNLLNVYGAQTVSFNLNYNAIAIKDEGPVGYGWTHDYQVKLIDEGDTATIQWNQYKKHTFTKDASGNYKPHKLYNPYDQLVMDGSDYLLTLKDKTQYRFDSSGVLVEMKNKHHQTLSFVHNANGDVEKVTEDISGRFLSFVYDANHKLETVWDNTGRGIDLTYDANGDLETITDAEGRVTTYTYNTYHQIETGTDHVGVQYLDIDYDSEGRVISIDDADPNTDAITYTYDEETDPGKNIIEVEDPSHEVTTYKSNGKYTYESIVNSLNQDAANYTYDDKRNVTSMEDALGNVTYYDYDANGNIKEVKDARGNITKFNFDSDNNLLTITNANNEVTTMTYDANNNLDLLTNALNKVTDYDYNSQSLLTSVEMPRGGTTSYTYTSGQVETVTDPASNTTTYSYDTAGRMETITDAANNTTTYTYDDMDNVKTITDPLNHSVSYIYNCWDQPLNFMDARSFVTHYEYNTKYQLEKIKQTVGGTLQETSFTYDDNGNLETVTDAEGHTVTYGYDALNRKTSITDALNNTVRFTYDEVGNLTQVKDANDVVVQNIQYDEVGNPETIEDAYNHTVTKDYDALNRLHTITDREGHLTTFNYDDLNRLSSAVDALNHASSVGYDDDGNRTRITDQNGNITQFAYDLSGRLETITADTGDTLDYQYNSRNLVSQVTNGRNQITTMQYDDASRLSNISDNVGTVSYTYDNNGNVLTVTDASGTITRTYDELNRIETYTDTSNNTISYTYDKVGNLKTITYPGNKTVTYAYTDANQLYAVTDWNNRVTTYSYDPNGRLETIARSNGTVQTMMYDDNGNLESMVDKDASNNVINEFTLTLDKVGNITTEDRTGGATYTLNNDFDAIYRLNQQQEVVGGQTNEQYDYSYDDGGNIKTIQTTSSTMQVQIYGDANRLTTVDGQTITHDADGNMTSGLLNGSLETFTYDARNRLTAVANTNYTYDAENNRTSITENGKTTTYVIDPNALLSRVLMKTEDGVTTYYVYGLGLIGEETDGVYSTYHYDLRGSTIALTNDSGIVTDTFDYGPYGELESRTGTTDIDYLYNGRDGVITDDNGLYYMRARYYNPEIKRFLSEDPFAGKYDDILNVNLYGYVQGNPIGLVDPSGYSSMLGQGTNARLNEIINTHYGEFVKGTGNSDYNVITFEDEIHGTINGNDKTLYPNKNWYAYEYRSKEGETGMTNDGKYEIAVGPKIIDPNYPDDGRIWASDLDGFNMNVDVVLENKKTGETKILSCYVTDIKAHTYNKYNGNGDNVSFEIDNGQVQTGVAYPNSWNFKHETPFSEYNSDGSVIEFIIKPTDFSPNDYRLKEIRTFN